MVLSAESPSLVRQAGKKSDGDSSSKSSVPTSNKLLRDVSVSEKRADVPETAENAVQLITMIKTQDSILK